MTFSHDELRELLAAYALGAVEDVERNAIDAHLETCDECRVEVDGYRRTAALLGSAPSLPPEGVWDRISEQLGDGPPPLRLSVASSTTAHPQHRIAKWALGVAAAAVVAIGAVGITMATTNNDTNNPANLAADRQRVASMPGAHMVTLTNGDATLKVDAVVMPDGSGYVFAGGLPDLPANQTYQLWAVMDNKPISAGLLGNNPETATFLAAGGPSALAITVEPAAGSITASTSPLVSGAMHS